MDEIVQSFNERDSDINQYLPFDGDGSIQNPILDDCAHIDKFYNLADHSEEFHNATDCDSIEDVIKDKDQFTDKRPDAVVKKAGISRSTYFRAKRNLKSHGNVRSTHSGKQIGRPQKLDATAEKLIQDELETNPASELKHLQALVLNKCNIKVSLSSISRRLKALGRSPSQCNVQSKRAARKRSEESHPVHEHVSLGAVALQNRSTNEITGADQFESLPNLEDYDTLHPTFGSDLNAYGSPSTMSLEMLEMQVGYSDLTVHPLTSQHDTSHMYKYENYDKDHDLDDYSPGLSNQDLYHHADHQRQMLFNDPDLTVAAEWQEV